MEVGLAYLDDVRGTRDAGGLCDIDDMSGDRPVEPFPEGGRNAGLQSPVNVMESTFLVSQAPPGNRQVAMPPCSSFTEMASGCLIRIIRPSANRMVNCRNGRRSFSCLRSCHKEAAKQRGKPQAGHGAIRERVIGRTDRTGDLAGDQANDHVRPGGMIGVGRHDDGRSALDAGDTRKVNDHHVTGFQQGRLPPGIPR